jgi:hypothetical protein
MIYHYNGDSINARPPITAISANKLNVVFKDSLQLTNIHFQTLSDKKAFLRWLTAI